MAVKTEMEIALEALDKIAQDFGSWHTRHLFQEGNI